MYWLMAYLVDASVEFLLFAAVFKIKCRHTRIF